MLNNHNVSNAKFETFVDDFGFDFGLFEKILKIIQIEDKKITDINFESQNNIENIFKIIILLYSTMKYIIGDKIIELLTQIVLRNMINNDIMDYFVDSCRKVMNKFQKSIKVRRLLVISMVCKHCGLFFCSKRELLLLSDDLIIFISDFLNNNDFSNNSAMIINMIAFSRIDVDLCHDINISLSVLDYPDPAFLIYKIDQISLRSIQQVFKCFSFCLHLYQKFLNENIEFEQIIILNQALCSGNFLRCIFCWILYNEARDPIKYKNFLLFLQHLNLEVGGSILYKLFVGGISIGFEFLIKCAGQHLYLNFRKQIKFSGFAPFFEAIFSNFDIFQAFFGQYQITNSIAGLNHLQLLYFHASNLETLDTLRLLTNNCEKILDHIKWLKQSFHSILYNVSRKNAIMLCSIHIYILGFLSKVSTQSKSHVFDSLMYEYIISFLYFVLYLDCNEAQSNYSNTVRFAFDRTLEYIKSESKYFYGLDLNPDIHHFLPLTVISSIITYETVNYIKLFSLCFYSRISSSLWCAHKLLISLESRKEAIDSFLLLYLDFVADVQNSRNPSKFYYPINGFFIVLCKAIAESDAIKQYVSSHHVLFQILKDLVFLILNLPEIEQRALPNYYLIIYDAYCSQTKDSADIPFLSDSINCLSSTFPKPVLNSLVSILVRKHQNNQITKDYFDSLMFEVSQHHDLSDYYPQLSSIINVDLIHHKDVKCVPDEIPWIEWNSFVHEWM